MVVLRSYPKFKRKVSQCNKSYGNWSYIHRDRFLRTYLTIFPNIAGVH